MPVPKMHKDFMRVYKQIYVPNMFPAHPNIWRAKIKHSDLERPYAGPLPITLRRKK